MNATGGPRRVLKVSGFTCYLPSPRAIECLVRLSHSPKFQFSCPRLCLGCPGPRPCVESPLDAFAPGVAGGPADVSCGPARPCFSESWAHRLASTASMSTNRTSGDECHGPRCGKVNPQSCSSQERKLRTSTPSLWAALPSEIVRSSTSLTSQGSVLLR